MPWIRAAVIIAILIGVTQQISGVNAIVYFAPTLMNQVGLPTENAVYTSIIIGVVSAVSCYVGLKIVDKVGRRRLLLVGLASVWELPGWGCGLRTGPWRSSSCLWSMQSAGRSPLVPSLY